MDGVCRAGEESYGYIDANFVGDWKKGQKTSGTFTYPDGTRWSRVYTEGGDGVQTQQVCRAARRAVCVGHGHGHNARETMPLGLSAPHGSMICGLTALRIAIGVWPTIWGLTWHCVAATGRQDLVEAGSQGRHRRQPPAAER